MITQQAKDHAQACYDATKESAAYLYMDDAQTAAYMMILANYVEPIKTKLEYTKPGVLEFVEAVQSQPRPSPREMTGKITNGNPPATTADIEKHGPCQCVNCCKDGALAMRPGYRPCAGYVAPVKGSSWMVWVLAASLIIVPVAVAFLMGVTRWQN